VARHPRQLAIANSLRQGLGKAACCVGALAVTGNPRSAQAIQIVAEAQLRASSDPG
jgi:hypothetical protein